jgi:hypothetical protein
VVRLVRRLSAVAVALGGLVASPAPSAAHPLHTTFTDVVVDPAGGGLRLTIRVFADDFARAAARHAGSRASADPAVADSVRAWYVASRLQVIRADGRRAALVWGGATRDGDALQLTVRVPGVRVLDGVRVGNALMVELFEDQVNLVRVEAGGRSRTLLFTRRDSGRLKAVAAA